MNYRSDCEIRIQRLGVAVREEKLWRDAAAPDSADHALSQRRIDTLSAERMRILSNLETVGALDSALERQLRVMRDADNARAHAADPWPQIAGIAGALAGVLILVCLIRVFSWVLPVSAVLLTAATLYSVWRIPELRRAANAKVDAAEAKYQGLENELLKLMPAETLPLEVSLDDNTPVAALPSYV
jgi:hypothetical protein